MQKEGFQHFNHQLYFTAGTTNTSTIRPAKNIATMSAQQSGAPPPYQEYVAQEDAGPYVPDDFKYSTKVYSCELPVRQSFTRKVYTLLSTQLLFTFAFSMAVAQYDILQEFMIHYIGLWWVALVASIVTCVWLSVCPRLEDYESADDSNPLLRGENITSNERSVPWWVLSKRGQLMLLSIFTLAEAYTISISTLAYSKDTVLSALLITTVIVIGVTLVATSGRFDYILESNTSIYYWLNWALWLLIGIGISSLFFGLSSGMDLFFGWLGAIVFTVYLFIDTQLIFRKVYPDEEIRCAMMLYLDIINLFLSILRILSHSEDN